jgi:hypothetical protein
MQLSQGSRDGVVFAATAAWVVNIASTKRLPSIFLLEYTAFRCTILARNEAIFNKIGAGEWSRQVLV